MSVKADWTKLLLMILIPWSISVKAVAVYLMWSFLRKSCHVLAVGVLEITIILKRDSGIQIFLNGDFLLNGISWVDLDGALKWKVERLLLFKERAISEAWRSEQKTLDMWANLGHFGKTGVYAGHCFIIHLPGGGQCPLVRDSEPIRLFEIPTSPSLYMLLYYIILYYIILYYIILYYIILYYIILYYIILYYIILYYIILYYIILYYIILYYIILYYIILYYIILYYIIL